MNRRMDRMMEKMSDDKQPTDEFVLEQYLPYPRYKTEWAERISKSGLEIKLYFKLPNEFEARGKLAELLVKHEVPIDSIEKGVWDSDRYIIQGEEEKSGSYKLVLNKSAKGSVNLNLKTKITYIGKLTLGLFKALHEYVGHYEEEAKKKTNF